MVKNFLIALKSLQQSKRAIQKTAEATDDLIGNKIANKTTSASTELHSKKSAKELSNDGKEENVERATLKKLYKSPEER